MNHPIKGKASTSPPDLKVLVVDDTITYRTILKEVVASIEGATVVGTAPTGDIALDKIRQLEPDMVLLDVEMPQMDGLQALEQIRELHPGVGVVMVSGTTGKAADSTIRALELGALDFVRKPESKDAAENVAYIRHYLSGVFAAFAARIARYDISKAIRVTSRTERRQKRLNAVDEVGLFDLLAIGCSTGGPTALMYLLSVLEADLPVPVVVVQHMPKGFTQSLCRNLNAKARLEVKEAEDGETLAAGRVYVAPGGYHLEIGRNVRDGRSILVARLLQTAPVNNCKPAVDVLFNSLARFSDAGVLSVVLTGMGRDGTEGLRALKARGRCYCVTQSQDSCVVYGMPRSVEQAGLSDSSLPLEAIGLKINSVIGKKEPTHV